MALKPSRYNFVTTSPDGKTLLFNARTGAFLAMRCDEKMVTRLLGGNHEEVDQSLLDVLISQGFLVNERTDEIKELERLTLLRRHAKVLRLTVMPTLYCNFRCPYCWESLRGPTMPSDVQESLKDFVEREAGRHQLVDVTWFGGEPLLAWPVIVRLSDHFTRVCEKSGCGYSATLITNGYLLTPEKIKLLRELHIDYIVTTLDGPPELHDRKRHLCGGGPTFATIYANLKEVVREGYQVCLQVNVDDQTGPYLEEFLDLIHEVKTGVTLHFRWIHPTADQWACKAHASETNWKLLEFNRLAVRSGFKVRLPALAPRWVHCNADYPNHWVIDPRGDLYKCNVEFELGNRVGKLENGGELRYTKPLQARWVGKDPFADPECRECRFLPICMGGCTFSRIATGAPNCVIQEPSYVLQCMILRYEEGKA